MVAYRLRVDGLINFLTGPAFMHWRVTLKKLSFLAVVFALVFMFGSAAQAQQFDLSFGVSGLVAPSSTATLQTIGGGAYPTFGLDFLFYHNLGVGFNAAFRAKQNLYQGFQPFRPFFYDVDLVYAPPLGKRAQLELSAGIGAESVRFYTPFLTCGTFTGCTNFVSSNHFLGQFGGAMRFYVTNKIFIRPEAHVYVVRNNFEFSGAQATRFGLSIGYSFKNQE
jgi:hypothetical protein